MKYIFRTVNLRKLFFSHICTCIEKSNLPNSTCVRRIILIHLKINLSLHLGLFRHYALISFPFFYESFMKIKKKNNEIFINKIFKNKVINNILCPKAELILVVANIEIQYLIMREYFYLPH